MNNIINMEDLKPSDFRELDRDHTCVVLPFAPVEYHGDHLPLGTDYFLAHEAMRSAARIFTESNSDWRFLFVPVIPLGADTVPHGGSLWVSPGLIKQTALEMSERLVEYGFRYIVLHTGHGGYRQMTALEEAASRLRLKYAAKGLRVAVPPTYLVARGSSIDIISLLNDRLNEPMTDEDIKNMFQESHGGKLETSYILHLKPDLMDDTYKTAGDHIIQPPAPIMALLKGAENVLPDNLKTGAEALAYAMTWFLGGAKKGYMGYPSDASPEFGKALHGAIAEILCGMLDELLIDDTYPVTGKEILNLIEKLAGKF